MIDSDHQLQHTKFKTKQSKKAKKQIKKKHKQNKTQAAYTLHKRDEQKIPYRQNSSKFQWKNRKIKHTYV